MKSLLTVLILTVALGAGYWKTQNLNAGVEQAKSDAHAAWQRIKLGMGTLAIRNKDAQTPSQSKLEEKLSSQASETDTRLSVLAQVNSDTTDELKMKLTEVEQKINVDDSQREQLLLSLQQGMLSMERKLESSQAINEEQLQDFKLLLTQNGEEQTTALQQSLDATRAELQAELDNLKAGNQNSSIALDSFTEKLASLDTRLDTLSSASVSNTTDATDSAANDAAIQAGLTSVTAQVDQRLAAIEERVALATNSDTRTMLETLTTNLDNATSNLDRLEATLEQNQNTTTVQFESMQQELAALQTNLESLTSTVESSSIENSQNELRQQLRELETTVKRSPESSTDLLNITTTLEKSSERLRTLEQRLTDIPASSKSVDSIALQDELQAQIAELESKLANFKAAPDEAIVSTLSEVQQKVTALESQNFITSDDIKKLTETKSIQYKVYFRIGSVTISEEAKKVLDAMIKTETDRATNISIFGTTDRIGSSEFNQQLAVRRASGVRSYLIQNGFDFTKIRDVDGIGEDLAAAALPDGKIDANQRSVIIFAFQP